MLLFLSRVHVLLFPPILCPFFRQMPLRKIKVRFGRILFSPIFVFFVVVSGQPTFFAMFLNFPYVYGILIWCEFISVMFYCNFTVVLYNIFLKWKLFYLTKLIFYRYVRW